MEPVRKKVITDPQNRPIAVEVNYEDWVRIEMVLFGDSTNGRETDLSRHVGKVDWPVDGVEYQRTLRGEWS